MHMVVQGNADDENSEQDDEFGLVTQHCSSKRPHLDTDEEDFGKVLDDGEENAEEEG